MIFLRQFKINTLSYGSKYPVAHGGVRAVIEISKDYGTLVRIGVASKRFQGFLSISASCSTNNRGVRNFPNFLNNNVYLKTIIPKTNTSYKSYGVIIRYFKLF